MPHRLTYFALPLLTAFPLAASAEVPRVAVDIPPRLLTGIDRDGRRWLARVVHSARRLSPTAIRCVHRKPARWTVRIW